MNNYQDLLEFVNNNPSDISQHLPNIFKFIAHHRRFNNFNKINLNLAVELGINTAQSSHVFNLVNKDFNMQVIGVDIEKCDYSNVYNGRFVHMDDIEFSKKFIEYVNKHNLQKTIDVLFIDTSHMYEHTKKEIECWFPFLSDNAIVIFHDTNMPSVFHKSISWDNNRGVIRAIEEYFVSKFYEERPFLITDLLNGSNLWKLIHLPESNGLTIMYKRDVSVL